MPRQIIAQIPRNQVHQFLDPESVKKLECLGEIVWNPFDRPFTQDELKERIRSAEAVITTWGSAPITEDIVSEASNLRLIAHMAGSVKPVIATMKVYDRGITVLNSNYAIAVSVSESVLAFILALGHRMIAVNQAMSSGVRWKTPEMETCELRGRTVGLVGLGMVAREVIKLLKPFEVRLIACDPYVPEETFRSLGVEASGLHEMIRQVDILSLHAPKIPETFGMIGRTELSLLKDGAMLINTARGDLIDEEALVQELKTGRILAGLDVFVQEPLARDSELRKLNNVLVRPHLAGVNPGSRRRIGRFMVDEMHRFYRGEPLLFEVRKEQLSLMT